MGEDVQLVRNQKWEVGDVEPVKLPDETYGECTRTRCHTVGELGNGVCQKCWDIGTGGDQTYRNRRRGKGKKKIEETLIIIS